MKSSVTTKPKSTVILTVEVTPAEMASYYRAAVAELATQVKVDGFRSGKAPRRVIEARLGKEALDHHALERAITDSYYRAIRKHHLQPISRPQTDLGGADHHTVETNGLRYTATVAVVPEVSLGKYRSVRVKLQPEQVKVQHVDEVLQQLRRSRATEAQVDRPAKEGDPVEIDFVGSRDGQEFPGGTSENHPLVIGENSLIPGFEPNLIGMASGQIKTFSVKFPKDYHEASLAGQKASFTVTMKQVKERILPELTDEFAKHFGARNLADLRERLTKNLQTEQAEEARRDRQAKVVDAVVDQATVDVPDALIEQELDRMIGEFRHQIEAQGLPYEKYLEHLRKTEDEIRSESRDQAERRVKTSLVLNAIQVAEKLHPKTADVTAEIKRQHQQAGDHNQQQQIDTAEFRDYVTRVLGNKLVIEKLVEWADGK